MVKILILCSKNIGKIVIVIKGDFMASKRRIRRKCCDGKRRYESKEEAGKALYGLVMNTKVTFREMNIYRCRFCKKYHIGHKPKKYFGGRR